MQVNIKGLDKGAVLKALHDGTQPLGMGRLHAINHLPLEQAQKEYAEALKQPVVVIAPGGTPSRPRAVCRLRVWRRLPPRPYHTWTARIHLRRGLLSAARNPLPRRLA